MQQQYKPYGQHPSSYVAAVPDQSHVMERAYRRRVRWVRVRWLIAGVIVGVFGGIMLTLVLATTLARPAKIGVAGSVGGADVSVAISEDYLNRVAAQRINGNYPTGVDGVTLTGLHIDLQPNNVMVLQPSFNVSALFVNLSTNATVTNLMSAQNGSVVINMQGDPQLGDLNIPVDALPFDLKGQIAGAVDKINNTLLVKEINDNLQSSLNGSDFTMQSLSTTDNSLVVNLVHK